MSEPLAFEEILSIGTNAHGYSFAVGRVGERWIGFAAGRVAPAPHSAGIFVFSELSEDYVLGLKDRDEAIRYTGALAQDPEQGYGGITRWHVPEALRGDPEALRCTKCGEIHPRSEPCDDFDADEWGEDLDLRSPYAP